jgi:hypothetical protein
MQDKIKKSAHLLYTKSEMEILQDMAETLASHAYVCFNAYNQAEAEDEAFGYLLMGERYKALSLQVASNISHSDLSLNIQQDIHALLASVQDDNQEENEQLIEEEPKNEATSLHLKH